MIKVFREWCEVPTDFTGVLCIHQEICFFKKGYYYNASGYARQTKNGLKFLITNEPK